jgi:hypothetical protein
MHAALLRERQSDGLAHQRNGRGAQEGTAADALQMETVFLRDRQRQRFEDAQFPQAISGDLVEDRSVNGFQNNDAIRIDRNPLLWLAAGVPQDWSIAVPAEQDGGGHLLAEIEPRLLRIWPAQQLRNWVIGYGDTLSILSLAKQRGTQLRDIFRNDFDAGIDGGDLHRRGLVDQEPRGGMG